MGSSASVLATPKTESPEEQLFAFKVLSYDISKGALGLKLSPDNPNPLPHNEVMNRVNQTWSVAVKEKDLPYLECQSPSVLMYKFSLLTTEEINLMDEKIMKELKIKDRADFKSHQSKANADYSQSFGGTEQDTKNEKEAAEILRGGDACDAGAVVGYISPYLSSPTILHQSERIALRNHGKWLRFLSNNGCYMYFHTVSKELHSLKPENFVEEMEVENAKDESNQRTDPANGLPVINVQDMPAEVERIIKELKKTPLLIDTSPNQVVRTFYSYNSCLEDISSLTIPFGKSGVKKEDAMERCRQRLVGAMKSGQYFVLYLGGVNIEHADLKNKLCKKDTFPKESMINAGRKLLEPEYEPKYKLIYREADLESGEAIVRDGFASIVVTTLSAFEYEKQLEDCIPLGYMHPIYIRTSDD